MRPSCSIACLLRMAILASFGEVPRQDHTGPQVIFGRTLDCLAWLRRPHSEARGSEGEEIAAQMARRRRRRVVVRTVQARRTRVRQIFPRRPRHTATTGAEVVTPVRYLIPKDQYTDHRPHTVLDAPPLEPTITRHPATSSTRPLIPPTLRDISTAVATQSAAPLSTALYATRGTSN